MILEDLDLVLLKQNLLHLVFGLSQIKLEDFPASFQKNDGSRVFPTDYTITQSDTWEKKVIIVPGDKNGSWTLYGNSTGMRFT